MFEWNDRYSVGIGSIDAQHQALFRLAGELHTAMITGQGKTASGKILARLIQYTMSHFAHEERLLRLNDYPDLAAHKEQHDALTRRVREFQANFERGQAAITVQLLHFLKDWLAHHIEGADQQYAPYLKGKAVA
jgi:hemerythrin